MLRKVQRVKTVIPKSNGIFGHMDYTFRDEVTKANLDLMFYANFGYRPVSPVVDAVQDEFGEQLGNDELNVLAALVLEKYKPKWDKLAEIYDIEYDPIHNYLDEWEDSSSGTKMEALTDSIMRTDNYGHVVSDDVTRTDNLTEGTSSSRDIDVTRTDNLTETDAYGKTDTRTDNLLETENRTNSKTGSGTENTSVFGFNSSTAVGSDTVGTSNTNSETISGTVSNTGTSANVSSGSDTVTNTGTQRTVTDDDVSQTVTNTGTRTDERDIVNSGSDTRSIAETRNNTENDSRDRDGRHFGNIGNLTSQKQILEEINLWRWNYMQEILNDVKEFCCLPTYMI